MKYICVDCGNRFSKKHDGAWHECTKCKGDAWWAGSSKFTGAPYIKKFVDVKAFGVDEKGREVAIDSKGNRVDPSKTRYDTKRDPKGWKATGKKVREKDKYGNPNS